MRPAAEGLGMYARLTRCCGLGMQVPYFAVRDVFDHLPEWQVRECARMSGRARADLSQEYRREAQSRRACLNEN
jgi:hypothetical protein